jgi:hypothetical protein
MKPHHVHPGYACVRRIFWLENSAWVPLIIVAVVCLIAYLISGCAGEPKPEPIDVTATEETKVVPDHQHSPYDIVY